MAGLANNSSIIYLESYIESTSSLPPELQRILTTVQTLDERCISVSEQIQNTLSQLLKLPPPYLAAPVAPQLQAQDGLSPAQQYADLNRQIQEEQRLLLQFAEEKVQLAQQAHDLLEMHALELEGVLDDFETDLRASGALEAEPTASGPLAFTSANDAPPVEQPVERPRERDREKERTRDRSGSRARAEQEYSLPQADSSFALPAAPPAPAAVPPASKPPSSSGVGAAGLHRVPSHNASMHTSLSGAATGAGAAAHGGVQQERVIGGSVSGNAAAAGSGPTLTTQTSLTLSAVANKGKRLRDDDGSVVTGAGVAHAPPLKKKSSNASQMNMGLPFDGPLHTGTLPASAAPPAAAAAAAAAQRIPSAPQVPGLLGEVPTFRRPPPAGFHDSAPRPQAPGLFLRLPDIGPNLVGCHAELFWPDDNLWYLIEIQEVDMSTRRAKVLYSTGDVEELDLEQAANDLHMSLIGNQYYGREQTV